MTEERDIFEGLEPALPRVAPPEGMFDRILSQIEASGQEAVVVPLAAARRFERRRLERRRLGRRPMLAVGVLAAAAAAAAVAIVAGRSPGPQLTARAAIVPHLAGAHVTGTAALYGAHTAKGTLRLTLDSVPLPAPGHHYEVWVLEKGKTAMSDVGRITPRSTTVKLRLALPAPGDYAAVDVSVQKDGGSKRHSSVSLAGGSFQPVS
jgi:hypothetical protein